MDEPGVISMGRAVGAILSLLGGFREGCAR